MDRDQRRYLSDKFANKRVKLITRHLNWYADDVCQISPETKFMWALRGLKCACRVCDSISMDAKTFGILRKENILLKKDKADRYKGNSRKQYHGSRLPCLKLKKMDEMVKDELEEINT